MEISKTDSQQFVLKCGKVAREVQTRGFKLTTPASHFGNEVTSESVAKFAAKPENARVEILKYLDRVIDEFGEFPELRATEMLNQGFEKESLQRHLWKTGTRFGNQSFIDEICDGDIIEIYNFSGIQIYRSWSCFEICSYSLSELLMYEWDELYERPSSMVAGINSKIGEALNTPLKKIDYNLPEYLMVEKFNGHENKIKFQMKNIFAVLDRKTGEPVGVCSTGRAQIWVSPQPTSNLSFL